MLGSDHPTDAQLSPPRVSLRALGDARIAIGDSTVYPDNERLFALALILTLSAGKVLKRDWLAETLWPEESASSARKHSLRQLVYRFRQLGGPVESSSGTICLAACHVNVDVVPPEPAALAASSPAEILRLSGRILPGFDPLWSRPLQEWVEATREMCAARIRTALVRALEIVRETTKWDAMHALSTSVLAHDPLNEEATVALAESLSMSGSRAEAIQVLERYEKEIGAESARFSRSIRGKKRRMESSVHRVCAGQDGAPFVGREFELRYMAVVAQRVRDGRGAALALWGEYGVGKSRLLREVASYAYSDGFTVQLISASQSTDVTPKVLLDEIASQLLTARGALGATPDSLEYLQASTTASRANGDGANGWRIDSALIALDDLVGAVTAEGPVLIAIDDVHRLSREARAALQEVTSLVLEHRVLLIATSLSEASLAESLPDTRVEARPLLPLGQGAARALARNLRSQYTRLYDALGDSLLDECVGLSGGVPRLLETLIAILANGGALGSLPLEVDAMIRSRIVAVGDGPRKLLQLVAVLEEYSTLERLLLLSGRSPQELVAEIEALERLGLIRHEAPTLRLAHRLLTPMVLEHLPPIARHALHKFAAGTLVSDARQLDDLNLLVSCAHHFVHGEARDEAVELLEDAARRLSEGGRQPSAIRLLSEACTRLDLYDRSRPLFKTLMNLTANGGAYAAGLRALRRLDSRNDASPLQVAARLGAGALTIIQKTSDEWPPLVRATEAILVNSSASTAERLEASVLLLALADNLGDAILASRCEEVMRSVSPCSPEDEQVRLRAEVIFHSSFGVLAKADSAAKLLLRLTDDCKDFSARATASYYASTPAMLRGDSAAAQQLVRDAYYYSQRGGLATKAMTMALRLAEISIHIGDEGATEEMLGAATASLAANEDDDNATAVLALRLRASIAFGWKTKGIKYPVPLSKILKMASVRQRVAHLAGYVELLTLSGGRQSSEAAAQLISDFLLLIERGGMDYPAAAIATHFAARDQAARGKQLLDTYASLRRDRGPLHGRLQAIIPKLMAGASRVRETTSTLSGQIAPPSCATAT
ncbi:MAG: AAA family ATPase [Gemmatimonadaceae bacterium]|nr:AAA family ATPase [Gemmatimonadaceae bacterium]